MATVQRATAKALTTFSITNPVVAALVRYFDQLDMTSPRNRAQLYASAFQPFDLRLSTISDMIKHKKQVAPEKSRASCLVHLQIFQFNEIARLTSVLSTIDLLHRDEVGRFRVTIAILEQANAGAEEQVSTAQQAIVALEKSLKSKRDETMRLVAGMAALNIQQGRERRRMRSVIQQMETEKEVELSARVFALAEVSNELDTTYKELRKYKAETQQLMQAKEMRINDLAVQLETSKRATKEVEEQVTAAYDAHATLRVNIRKLEQSKTAKVSELTSQLEKSKAATAKAEESAAAAMQELKQSNAARIKDLTSQLQKSKTAKADAESKPQLRKR